jgi:caffeoyl-CoA O-methyltransferase
MANKTLPLCAGLLLALAAGLVMAADDANQTPQPQMPPGQSPLLMTPLWMDRLDQAYVRNDMREIGRLVTEMRMKRAQASMKGESSGRLAPAPPPARPAPVEARQTLTSTPLGKTEAEKKALAVLDMMDKSQRRGMMNVPEEDGRLLRLLVAAVDAKNVIEIGTSNGYSGIWMCLALRNTGGKLTTFEINPDRAALARTNFELAGVSDLVTLVEGDAHEKVADLKDPIDVLFIDADKEGYIDYLNKLLPLVRPGGLVLAHNMTPQMADPRYVKAITENPDLETLFINGMGVTLKKR